MAALVIVKTKKVYYCEYCRKHRLTAASILKHERYCTRNPDRTCRWQLGNERHVEMDLRRWAGTVGIWHRYTWVPPRDPRGLLIWLREETGGCPACMYAAIRQSGLRMPSAAWLIGFDWATEVARFREAEQAHWATKEIPF